MSQVDTTLENRLKAKRYVENVFLPAEQFAQNSINQLLWLLGAFQQLRNTAQGIVGENKAIPEPPMTAISFEELGRIMDKHIKAVNDQFPEWGQNEPVDGANAETPYGGN